jgi:RluA family pseudouridine synthase
MINKPPLPPKTPAITKIPALPPVLYCDESLLCIHKPAGLTTLPDGYDPGAPHVKSLLASQFGELWFVHRLDRETSGVLLLARTPEAHRLLCMQFEGRSVEKVYHALVAGAPSWDERRVSAPLRTDAGRQHRTVVDARQGLPAVTHLKVLERFGLFALLEARPQTGRTHQVRAHLASQGHPVAVDPLYGKGEPLYLSKIKPRYKPSRGEERPLLGRLGLHALSLKVDHPLSGERLDLLAPYPKDLETVVRNLRRFRSSGS